MSVRCRHSVSCMCSGLTTTVTEIMTEAIYPFRDREYESVIIFWMVLCMGHLSFRLQAPGFVHGLKR
jgi:hypothetical protein